MTRIAALLPHFVYLSSRFPSFWFSSGSCIIAFQVFSAMHFFFFKFKSFHSVNLLLQNASFFAGSSRALCLLMLFLLHPLIFTVALVFFVFLHSHPSLVLHVLWFPFGIVISVSQFGLCPPMIKTQNTEQDPFLIFRKQRKKYLHAGKTQNKQLKRSLLSHISFEHTKQGVYSHY